MGYHGWQYYVLFQPDMEAALQALRQDVFRSGQFENPKQDELADLLAMDDAYYLRWQRHLIQNRGAQMYAITGRKPDLPAVVPRMEKIARLEAGLQTLEGLLQLLGEQEGATHSILDMPHIAQEPGMGTISCLPTATALEIFGTDHPTYDLIEAQLPHVKEHLRHGQGYYLIVYDVAGTAVEYCFIGSS